MPRFKALHTVSGCALVDILPSLDRACLYLICNCEKYTRPSNVLPLTRIDSTSIVNKMFEICIAHNREWWCRGSEGGALGESVCWGYRDIDQ